MEADEFGQRWTKMPTVPFNLDKEVSTIKETLPFLPRLQVLAVLRAVTGDYCADCGGLNGQNCVCGP